MKVQKFLSQQRNRKVQLIWREGIFAGKLDNRATKQKVLNVVDVGSKSVAFLFARVDVVKLDVVVEAFLAERDGVVDLDRFRELSVGLQVASLVGRVLQDDVGLAILVVSETDLKKKPNKCF